MSIDVLFTQFIRSGKKASVTHQKFNCYENQRHVVSSREIQIPRFLHLFWRFISLSEYIGRQGHILLPHSKGSYCVCISKVAWIFDFSYWGPAWQLLIMSTDPNNP